jgi:hypothetical protein
VVIGPATSLALALLVVAAPGQQGRRGVGWGGRVPHGYGSPVPQAPQVLPLEDRDALHNRWLKTRFETVLPAIMRREQIDMWLVICREHNEDPVYMTLVDAAFTSKGTFFLNGRQTRLHVIE